MLGKMSLCSAEEDGGLLDVEDDLHSPTDVSEDSVEVRVTPIAGPRAHQRQQSAGGKRKLTESKPSLKRRRPTSPASPFRPWSIPSAPQEEPLALVKARDGDGAPQPQEVTTAAPTIRVIPRPARSSSSRFSVESIIGEPSSPAPNQSHPRRGLGVDPSPSPQRHPLPPAPCSSEASSVDRGGGGGEGEGEGLRAPSGTQQRNYKNMTRERRIEANARERTRVHTISAAFDTLRRAVPAYSHCQKLSKLSVLRIACSYILTLSRVAGLDYSADRSSPPIQDCVDLVTRTIQTEGKLRRRRDD